MLSTLRERQVDGKVDDMGDIKVAYLTIGPAATNCYIVYREGAEAAVVIDPAHVGEKIFNDMAKAGLKCEGMLLTHGHYDHLRGAKRLQQLCDAKVYAYETEKAVCESSVLNVSRLFGEEYTLTPDAFFRDNEEFDMAGIHFKVLHTPGHTPGGCCYYVEESGMLFAGDTLFKESVGRTDFEGGSTSDLVRAIKDRILPLPENTLVFPGHGEITTVGDEKANNPFIQ